MLIKVVARPKAGPKVPARSKVLHSTATPASKRPVGGIVSTVSAPGRVRNAAGTPSALPTCAGMPRRARASRSANADPTVSPSGATWQAMRTLRLFRRTAAIWSGGFGISLVLSDLADQAHYAHASLNRVVQAEQDLGGKPHLQPPAQLSAHVSLGTR